MELIDRKKLESDDDYRLAMRRKCQTDLLFLGRVLGYTLLLDRVHGPVAELCVQKNPDLPIEEQHRIKQRLHLDPRGTFKSTFSIIDSVQWIICFPDVRISKFTATKPLATAIAGEITDHFVKAAHAEATDFQALFPEYCISPRDKRIGEYTAPCRTVQWKEQTVMAFSNETTVSGWHFDVMDPDDVVDNQNTLNATAIRKVKKNFKINKKTLMPWGYLNFKGTRYNPFDLWGDIIDNATPGKVKLLIRSALKVKDGKRLEPGQFPAEADVELLFPELLSYEFLKGEFEDDFESFMTQYMNDAKGGNQENFPKEEMMAATVEAEHVPVSGQVFIHWRFAYSGKANMRNTGAAIGIMDGGRLYVVDAIRSMYKPSDLAHTVVKTAKKWGTHQVNIEATPGARYLEATIQNYALTLGWELAIRWTEYQDDDGTRDLRIKGAEPLIATKRLLFSDGISSLGEMNKQFANYGMMDDMEFPDVISRLAENLPKSIAVENSDPQQELAWELAKQRDMYDRVHGLGQYDNQIAAEEETYTPPGNSMGLDDILGGLNG